MNTVNFRGIDIKVGDKLKVVICKGVEKTGVVTFNDASYCLDYYALGAMRSTALTTYAKSCKFELLKEL